MSRKSQKREKLNCYIPRKNKLKKMNTFNLIKIIRMRDKKKVRKKKINMKKYQFKNKKSLMRKKKLNKKKRKKKNQKKIRLKK